MAETLRVICESHVLSEGGAGVRFAIEFEGHPMPAFVIRYRGKVHAYFNRCAHIGVELDLTEGEFFDYSGLYLICSTHGATYVPESGFCVAGPCKGARLKRLAVEERNGKVYLFTKGSKHGG